MQYHAIGTASLDGGAKGDVKGRFAGKEALDFKTDETCWHQR